MNCLILISPDRGSGFQPILSGQTSSERSRQGDRTSEPQISASGLPIESDRINKLATLMICWLHQANNGQYLALF